VQRLIKFYVEQNSKVTPHAAFAGQTPDEVFFGIGDDIAFRLAEARGKRLAENRSAACGAWRRRQGRC
jgi:putative transposase